MTEKSTGNTPHVLVTGGTGFLGKHVCNKLGDEGYTVIVLTRNIQKSACCFKGNVQLVDNLDSLSDDIAIHAIIGLAGEPVAQRWTEASRERMIESRLEDIRKLKPLIKRLCHKPEVYIRASAIGWYGTDTNLTFNESSSPAANAGNRFAAHICTELEKETGIIAALGIRTCNVRIGLVLGEDGGPLHQMLLPFSLGVGGTMGSGKQWWSWIHIDDMVRLIIHLMRTPEANGIYNGTAPEPVTNRDFAHALGKAMHRPAFMPLPSFVLRLILGKVADEVVLQGQRVLPKRTLESGFVFQYPDLHTAFANIFQKGAAA